MDDIVGGDKIGGDKVGGDKVGGDKVGGNKVNDSLAGALELKALADELEKLRAEMKNSATSAEQDVAVGAVAQAAIEAKKGDKSRALEFLSKAGEWALDVATKIGVSVAVEALKQSIK